MTFEKKPVVTHGGYSFDEVVGKACEELMDRQIKYSIGRIQKMEEQLADIEKELDVFLYQHKAKVKKTNKKRELSK